MTATCEKHSPFWKVISLLMALVMIFSIAAVPAAAATSVNKTVVRASSESQMTKIKVTTGKGLLYKLGIKKTTLTIKNTNPYYSVAIYQKTGAGLVYKFSVNGNQTQRLTLKGSAKSFTFVCQLENTTRNVTLSASVNAGSVS